ncbi:MAG: hypothetical protein L0H31_06495 [Nocardioidaceae bacterium]|nr:hypothetical protein [Nocardioidaceae bacterium]
MIGHLGHRVSALLDGQLSARETEEAWTHVYNCHGCRDLVEREGWIKTRLAGLCGEDDGVAPSGLKGSLLNMPPHATEQCLIDPDHRGRRRRAMGVVFLGGGAVGATMVGILALGVAPGSGPPAERRPPVTQIDSDLIPSEAEMSPSPTPRRTVPVHHGDTGFSDPVPASIVSMIARLVP